MTVRIIGTLYFPEAYSPFPSNDVVEHVIAGANDSIPVMHHGNIS